MARLIGTYIKSNGTIVAFEKTLDKIEVKDYGCKGQNEIDHLEFLAKEFPNLIHRTETKLEG